MTAAGGLLAEARSFLAAHPELVGVDLLVTDTAGILRGKRIRPAALAGICEHGLRLPGSMFSMDATGAIVYGTGLLMEEGERDRLFRPVAGSLKPVPWAERPMAQALVTAWEEDGQAFFADPRQVLAGVADRFAGLGRTPRVAVELEFYLIDRQADRAGAPQPPVSPVSGRRPRANQVYGIAEIEDFAPVLDDIAAACAAQDVAIHTTVPESAAGHFEVNLAHRPGALEAADQAVMLKRLVRGVASRHGMDASFMAKPYAERSASGMHVHVSLVDEAGVNLFATGDARGSALLGHAVAGLCRTMDEAMAIFAANANSFRRYREDSFVPTAPSWGYNNRTTALRVPPGPTEATRIEHRVAGADANVYLVLAAILAGMHHGIVGGLAPPPATEGDGYAQHGSSLPLSWRDALRAFDAAAILPDYLAADYCALYSRCKWRELERFEAQVSPLEHDWYLRTL